MVRNRAPPEEERQLVYEMRQRRTRREDEMGARLQAVEEVDTDDDTRLGETEVVRGKRFIRWRMTRLLEENEMQDHTGATMY